MTLTPQDVFERFFSELSRQNIPYVILHSYEKFPDEVGSDVDYAVRDEDLARALQIHWSVAETCDWVVAQTFQHEICGFYTALIDPDRPQHFLKLDVCSHYVRNGCLFLRADRLLKDRRSYRGFSVPAPSIEFVYVLAKVFAKRKDLAEFLPRLRELWIMEPAETQREFLSFFGDDAGELKDWFAHPPREWLTLSSIMHRRNRYSFPLRMKEYRRRVRRVIRPAGLRLAILGADGAGKSELISRLKTLLEPCFRKQVDFHFCPMLFRKLGEGAVSEPQKLPPRTTVISAMKVLYHFLDHWLGYVFEQLPAILHSKCVVFDRDFDDLLIDPLRYRLQNAAWLARPLRRLLPSFQLTFVLNADPEVIHRRKLELTLEELKRQRGALRQMASTYARFILVDANDAPANVAHIAAHEVIEFMAVREQQRARILGIAPPIAAEQSWESLFAGTGGGSKTIALRVVRRWGHPFLLLPANNRLAAQALSLYPAQSLKGRLGKSVLWFALAARLPIKLETASVTAFRQDPFVQLLAQQAGTGRGTVPDFAILCGNPHAVGRRFVLVVFDLDGKPAAVIKAAADGAAANLVRQEESVLSAIDGSAQGMPRLRGSLHEGHIHALVLDFHQGDAPTSYHPDKIATLLTSWVHTGETVVLTETALWQRLRDRGSMHPLTTCLSRRLGDKFIHPALFHGDFAPWNIKVSPTNGAWTVLDWERGDRRGIPGWDWFHYVVQTGILVEKNSVEQLADILKQVLDSPLFSKYAAAAGIADIERDLLLAYLLHSTEVLRSTEGRQQSRDLLYLLAARWLND